MGIPVKLIGASAALAILACAPAQAADSDAWSGFYLGGGAGNREQTIDWEQRGIYFPDGTYALEFPDVDDSSKSNNSYFSLYGGYNWLVSERVLLGLELAVGYADSQSPKNYIDFSNGLGFPSETSNRIQSDWDANLRGRAGYLITPNVLFYGAAGIAATRLESSTHCPSDFYVCAPVIHESHDEIVLGWTAGLGLEASLSEHLLARAEYQYSDYQSTSFWAMSPTFSGDAIAFGVKNEVDTASQKLTLGLAYKF
jgi:outer membrane immunogenic protein